MVRHQPQLAQIDAVLFIEAAHLLHRAVEVDRVLVPGRAQLRDHALRLSQRIGANEHAAVGMGAQPVEELGHLFLDRRMAEDRQAEGGLGDEYVAGDDFERRAGRIGAALVVAGDDHALARMFEQDLRAAQNMARRHIGRIDAALQADRLAIFDRHSLVRNLAGTVFGACAIAQFHDRERFGRRHRAAMPTACMVCMTVGHERMIDGTRGIDPAIGRLDIDPVRFGFDPGKGCAHRRFNDGRAANIPIRRLRPSGTCRTSRSRRWSARPAGSGSG